MSRSDPKRAKLLNIRYKGLQASSMREGYERVKAGMRLCRLAGKGGSLYAAISPAYQDGAQMKSMLATEVAFYMGWLGHYIAGDGLSAAPSKPSLPPSRGSNSGTRKRLPAAFRASASQIDDDIPNRL